MYFLEYKIFKLNVLEMKLKWAQLKAFCYYHCFTLVAKENYKNSQGYGCEKNPNQDNEKK